jgi:hypothetical protein
MTAMNSLFFAENMQQYRSMWEDRLKKLEQYLMKLSHGGDDF